MQENIQYQSLLDKTTKFYPLTKENIAAFQSHIHTYYEQNKRNFPWRNTKDPYHILVSEFMLQQTQTSRVIEKYHTFINQFPDFTSLANASTAQVLTYWAGLGYNRRAVFLKKCAEKIHNQFDDKLPRSEKALQKISGIGPYTAAAITVFVFNEPVVMIETNIRAVYIHFFFQKKTYVDDKDIRPYIQKTIDMDNPRDWFYALMDYGVMLKKNFTNPSRKSRQYFRQTPFNGSQRQIRGNIIKLLITESQLSVSQFTELLKMSSEIIIPILKQLEKEQILIKDDSGFYKIRK